MRPITHAAVALVAALLPMMASAEDIRMGFRSAGPVAIGARLGQLGIALREPIDRTTQDPSGRCFYVAPLALPRFEIMVVDERVVRFDVYGPGVATTEGVHVGDPVSTMRKAYGDRLKSAPNAYNEDDLDYTVPSADGGHAFRFETHGGQVTGIFAGEARAVAYIEGCL